MRSRYGRLLELKEKQLHRAKQGSRDDLRDRDWIKRLPVNGHAPHGSRIRYDIQDGKKVPVAFEVNPQVYSVASPE